MPDADETPDDRWARIRLAARAIPADVDLDDDAAVIAALHRARFLAADFADCLDEIISEARMLRERDWENP